MKIVVLDGYPLNPGDLSWAGLSAIAPCTVYDVTPPEAITERIGDADIVFTNKTPLSRETFDRCPQIRYVGVLATGYNVVDAEGAKAHGVCVTNIPTYGTMAVAQFVFALLLELCHHVGHHSDAVRAGRWTQSRAFSFWDHPLIELDGKVLGIVGLGRIGRQVARIGQALGMEVIAYEPGQAAATEGVRPEPLAAVLRLADVLTLHCPLTDETAGMIDQKALATMKDGALLINTSRGPLLVEADVRAALDSGKLAGAGLDVVSVEPIQPDNPLLGAPNCLITPHIAWAPVEARGRLMAEAEENLCQYLQGNERNRVL